MKTACASGVPLVLKTPCSVYKKPRSTQVCQSFWNTGTQIKQLSKDVSRLSTAVDKVDSKLDKVDDSVQKLKDEYTMARIETAKDNAKLEASDAKISADITVIKEGVENKATIFLLLTALGQTGLIKAWAAKFLPFL